MLKLMHTTIVGLVSTSLISNVKVDEQFVKPQARRKRGAEGALAPPVFGRTVNPISTRGGRLCPP